MHPAWTNGRCFCGMEQLCIPDWQLGEEFRGTISTLQGRCWLQKTQCRTVFLSCPDIMASSVLKRKSNLDKCVPFTVMKDLVEHGGHLQILFTWLQQRIQVLDASPVAAVGWLISEFPSEADRVSLSFACLSHIRMEKPSEGLCCCWLVTRLSGEMSWKKQGSSSCTVCLCSCFLCSYTCASCNVQTYCSWSLTCIVKTVFHFSVEVKEKEDCALEYW